MVAVDTALDEVASLKYDWVILQHNGVEFIVIEIGKGGLRALIPRLSPVDVYACFFHASEKGCRAFFFVTWIGDMAPKFEAIRVVSLQAKLPQTTPPAVSIQCGSIEDLASLVEEYLHTAAKNAPLPSAADAKDHKHKHASSHHHRHHSDDKDKDKDKDKSSHAKHHRKNSSQIDSKAAKDTKDAKDTSKDSSKDSYKETPKEELERAREEISNIKEQLSKAESGATALHQKCQLLVTEVQQMQERRHADISKIEALESETDTLKNENETLRNENDALKAQLRDLLNSQLTGISTPPPSSNSLNLSDELASLAQELDGISI